MEKVVEFILSEKMISTLVTIFISSIIIAIINGAMNKLEISNAASIRTKKRNTILTLISNIITYLIMIIALVVILSTWGVNVTGIVTSLGVVGVIGGLALQDALKDIIAGCNIIMDDYFVVGDIVKYKDFTGTVIEFGLKKTKIKGFDGTVLTIANRQISEIENLSAEDTVWLLDLPVAYEISEKKVMKVLDSIFTKIKDTGLTIKEPEYLGINGFMESNINYLISVTCKAKDRYVLRRKILSIVKEEFDSNNIKIPYPQVEVHNGK
jgi:small conductance mechanosensitive channel